MTSSEPSQLATVADVEPNKVFIGNLSFQCTKESIKQFLTPAGKVTNVEIVMRGSRSLGYAFVTFEEEAEATAAVTTFDQNEMDGRVVKVQLAKPKVEKTDRPVRHRAPRRRNHPGQSSRVDEGEEGTGDVVVVNHSDAVSPKVHTWGEDASRRGRRPRTRRLLRSPPDGEPSQTTIYVSNLPYAVDDERLKEIFEKYNVASAHVVKRFTGRSRGFGFVDLLSHEDQQQLLVDASNFEVDGRTLSIKVATSEQRPPAEKGGENKPENA
jgi:RNA recognition motif-containing protein